MYPRVGRWVVRTMCALSLGAPATAMAQDLEPRVYLASPTGTNVVGVGIATARGDVLVDPTVPVKDAEARVGSLGFVYVRSLDLFGRSASVSATFPLVRARATGTIGTETIRANHFGQGDGQFRLTVNLVGTPAMNLRQFAARGRHLNLGASLVAVAPFGQYDSANTVNIGANRWAFKPELGLSAPFAKRWLLDAYFGSWFFETNPDYLGRRRAQAPLLSTQLHVSYNLSVRAWAAFDATFYAGGRLTVNGVANLQRQHNTRLGGTLSLPLGRRQSIKIAASRGAWVRLGTNFTSVGVSWNVAWGMK